jgi:hypothetical protein
LDHGTHSARHDFHHGHVADLLMACGRGSEEALGELFDLFYPLFAARARSEDEVVAAFCTLWRRAPEYSGVGSPIGWIVRVTEPTPGAVPPAVRRRSMHVSRGRRAFPYRTHGQR